MITVYLGIQTISAYGLVGIAVTRFISIRDPFQFTRRVTHGRALVGVVFIWIGLLLLSGLLYFRVTPSGRYIRIIFINTKITYFKILRPGHNVGA